MRVVSGSVRGRKLKAPAGSDIRPTADLIKESIFNIVQFDIEGRRVLDIFAGTGQLGIEALSRGARSAVFVDFSQHAVKLINENLKLCGLSENARVVKSDALKYLQNSEKFDLIFIDPPYSENVTNEVFQKIIEFDKLNDNGIIIFEMSADRAAPTADLPYKFNKEYKYGGVKIVKYSRESHSEKS